MREDTDHETDRVGIGCGCLAAALFAVPTWCIVWLGMTLGDCFEGNPCRKSDHGLLLSQAVVLALAVAIGFAAQAVALWWVRRRRGEPVRVPIWAVIVLLPFALPVLAYAGAMLASAFM